MSTMAKTKTKTKKQDRYFTLDHLLNRKPDILLVWGQRTAGKTYSSLKLCLERYKNKGQRFIYVRRWKEDIKAPGPQQLFTPLPINEIFGGDFEINYYNGVFNLVNLETGEKEEIGFLVCLSDAYHRKSVAYTGVKTIIFDEFIQQTKETIMAGEIDRWESIVNTVCRDKTDLQIILLGNSVNIYSPYFTLYGINVKSMKQGDIVEVNVPNEKGITKIVAEYGEYREEIGKDASKYIFKSKMTTKGAYEIPEVDDIPKMENEIVNEKLLFTAYDSDAQVNIGVFLRTGVYTTMKIDDFVYKPVKHMRQFLVIRETERTSKYYHLTIQKSLDYSTYNDFKMLLNEIKDETEIDFVNELYRGRVYAENMFVANFFDHVWATYFTIKPRDLL